MKYEKTIAEQRKLFKNLTYKVVENDEGESILQASVELQKALLKYLKAVNS